MNSRRGLAADVLPNLVAGLTSGLVALVYSISFAALIFSEKLSQHFPQGIGTALIGATITAIIVAWRSPFPFSLAGPEANSAIILALAARSIANAMDSPAQRESVYPTVWAAIILSTGVTGLFLYLLGRFRLGQLARYVPYPVIGGFLAGTGWLITRSSFKVTAGFPLGFAELAQLMRLEVLPHWVAGVLVAAILFFVLNRFSHFLVLPGLMLAGVVVANLVWFILKNTSLNLNHDAWFFKPFSQAGIWQAWSFSTFKLIDWTVLSHQSGTLLAMTVIVMLSILLNSTGLELATSRHVDLNHELQASGVANLVNAAFGGLVGYLSINRSLLNQRAGATSPLAGIIAGVVSAIVLVFGSSFLSYVPRALLGGLLLYIGVNLLIHWVYQSWSQLPRFDYLLVICILVVVVTVGFIAGIASGVLIACLLFIVSYSKTSSIKHQLSGKTYHSNVVRSASQQEILDREGSSIAMIVLHGFVFFGTANGLLDRIRRQLTDGPTVKLLHVIFDFRLVTGLDSSAVLSFMKLNQLATKSGLYLVFTHLSHTIESQLTQGGLTPPSGLRSFPDLDRGVEWCENQVLAAHQMLHTPSAPLAEQLRAIIADANLASEFLPYLQKIELGQGQHLFRQGEASDGLYFLETGRVSIVLELPNGTTLRRRTYTSGTILGDMGFYSGEPRSASVIADQASRLHYLSQSAFSTLQANAPLLAASFNHGIINLIAERLRRSEEEVKILRQ